MSLDFEEASDKAKVFQKTVTSISPETISSGIKGLASTVATLGKTFVQFGVMLLTNPIFLLVAAITAIVVAIGALMNSLGLLKPIINAVGNFFKGLMSIINSVVDGIKSALDWVGLTDYAGEELAKKQKQRNDEEIERSIRLREEKEAFIEATYNREQTTLQRSIDLLKAEGKETTSLERKKIQASINYQKQQLNELNLLIQTFEEAKKQNSSWGVFDAANKVRIEKANELKDQIAGTENELKILDANAKREAQQRAEKAAEKQKEIRDREREAKKNAIEEIRQLENEYRRSQLTEQERELEDIKIKYEEQIKAAKKYGVDTKTLEANYAAEKAAVVKKYEDEAKKLKDEKDAQDLADQEEANQKRIELEDKLFNLQRELEYKKLSEREANKQKEIDALVSEYDEKYLLAVNNAELTKQLEEQQKSELKAIDDKYKKEQEKADEEAKQKKIQATIDTGNQIAEWTKQGLTAINDIVSAFAGESEKQQEKAFKIQKATNIAMAVIDTLKGGVSAYMSQIVANDPTSVPSR